jgi:hypothetical protein
MGYKEENYNFLDLENAQPVQQTHEIGGRGYITQTLLEVNCLLIRSKLHLH